jgi:heat shock protein HspQ
MFVPKAMQKKILSLASSIKERMLLKSVALNRPNTYEGKRKTSRQPKYNVLMEDEESGEVRSLEFTTKAEYRKYMDDREKGKKSTDHMISKKKQLSASAVEKIQKIYR